MSEIEATIAAHRSDYEALIREHWYAPDGLGELLVGAARALINARATIRTTAADGDTHRLICEIPTAELIDPAYSSQ